MSGSLFFEDSKGNLRLVNPNVSLDTIYSEITRYVENLNPNFHIFYIRNWTLDNGDMKYDVGSHTEFFVVKPKCCISCKHFLGGGDFGTCCSKDHGLWYASDCCDKWEAK